MKAAPALLPALFALGALALPPGHAAVAATAPPPVNVVSLAVTGVAAPAALPGLCRISGEVGSVFEGSSFTPGQAITITAPCARTQAAGRSPVDLLKRARFIAAQVDARGRVVSQGRITDYGGMITAEPLVMIIVEPEAG